MELLMCWQGHRLAKENVPVCSDLELSVKYIYKRLFLIHLFENSVTNVEVDVCTHGGTDELPCSHGNQRANIRHLSCLLPH